MSEERKTEATKTPRDRVAFWRNQLVAEERENKRWRQAVEKKVLPRYRDTKRKSGKSFNIFWSTVETLKSVVYSATPNPHVQRRYLDKDETAKAASELLERGLKFCTDEYDFDTEMEAVRDDVLIVGRGVARINYDATIVERMPESQVGEDGSLRYLLDDEEVEVNDRGFVEEKTDERIGVSYVYWKDYHESPARRWKDVWWTAYDHELTRDELIEKFGADKGARVPLVVSTVGEEGGGRDEEDPDDSFGRAKVTEIWDKTDRKRLWIAAGFDEMLDEEDDPLGLEGFFPNPEPVYAIKTSDSRVPVPEFTRYQDQADQLDAIEERIFKLTKALKACGVYDGVQAAAIDLLAGASDGELKPIETASQLRDKGGLRGAIFMNPIEDYAAVLGQLYQQREVLKATINEIIGVSDLVRGATKASETATAQELKGKFGAMRMTPRSKPMQRFARDLFRLAAELMAEHFDAERWAEMTGIAAGEEVIELLRDEKVRGFRIDIESDSTVRDDILQEKREVTEYITAVTQFMQAAGTIGQQAPVMVPVLMEMLKFSVRRFKAGRQLEAAIEKAAEGATAQAAQPKGPDPELEIKKGELERKARKDAGELDIDRKRLALDAKKAGADIEERGEDRELDIKKKSMDVMIADEDRAATAQSGMVQ